MKEENNKIIQESVYIEKRKITILIKIKGILIPKKGIPPVVILRYFNEKY